MGLSRKHISQSSEEGEETSAETGARGGQPRGRELRGGTGSDTSPLIIMPANAEAEEGNSGITASRQ